MREIKFRAVKKSTKEIFKVTKIDLEDGYIYYNNPTDSMMGYYSQEGDIEDFVLLQFTGLYDKNGKEIYEGDICNCREYECFGKVEWNNEEAGFYFCVVVEGGGFEEEHLYDYIDELEVIGNIHDNPELLESEGN